MNINKILTEGFNKGIITENPIIFLECSRKDFQEECPTTSLLKRILEEGNFLGNCELACYTTKVEIDGQVMNVFKRCARRCLYGKLFWCVVHKKYEFQKEGGVQLENGGFVCKASEGEHWEYCSECGEPVLKEEMLDGKCLNCADTVEIYEYHEFDELEFFGSPTDDIYYGVEIETSYNKSQREREYLSSYNLFRKVLRPNRIVDNISHYEEDCSISGIECVTQPMSYEFTQNNLHHIIEHLDECGFHTENGNGLHIHISRTNFVDDNLYKILSFFESHKNDIITFSGRSRDELRRWADFYYTDDTTECVSVLEDADDRYYCINNTNDNTVEFRIFRSELDTSLVLGAVEFIQILLDMIKKDFCMNYISFDDVVDFAHSYNYDNFIYRYEYYML